MNIKTLLLLAFSLLLFSCSKEERTIDSTKAIKHNEAVFKEISQSWKFDTRAVHPKVQSQIKGWHQWRMFNEELQQKPKSSLNAFRLKAKNLSVKAEALNVGIPQSFSKPAVKSRIATLNTKVKALEMYITLEYIPVKKVIALIQEISSELNSIQNQMNEIIVKSEIRKEEGEEFMLQALDTTRHARRELQENQP